MGARLFLCLIILFFPVLLAPSFMPTRAAAQPALLVQKTWGGNHYDSASGVAVDSFGNIYTTGRSASYGPGSPSNSNLTLLKYNLTGGLLWQEVWSGRGSGSDIGYGVAVDALGDVYVTGGDWGHSGGALILKFNSTGASLWERTWIASRQDYGTGIAVDSSGNIYVTGSTESVSMEGIFLLKLNSTGNLLWQKTWLGLDLDTPGSVAVDSSGNIYVTTESTRPSYAYFANILKFDSAGNLLWQKMWDAYISGVAVDLSGNVYVTGEAGGWGDANLFDALLMKFSAAGGLLWQRTWGGSGVDSGSAVAVNSSGIVFVTGATQSYGSVGACGVWLGMGCSDVFLLKFNSVGSLLFQETWGGSSNDAGNGVAVDSLGNAVVVGYVNESTPYMLDSPNGTLRNPHFILGVANGTVSTPSISLGIPTGTVQAVSGNESYSGGTDQFLIGFDASTTTPITVLATSLTWVEVIFSTWATATILLIAKRRRGTRFS